MLPIHFRDGPGEAVFRLAVVGEEVPFELRLELLDEDRHEIGQHVFQRKHLHHHLLTDGIAGGRGFRNQGALGLGSSEVHSYQVVRELVHHRLVLRLIQHGDPEGPQPFGLGVLRRRKHHCVGVAGLAVAQVLRRLLDERNLAARNGQPNIGVPSLDSRAFSDLEAHEQLVPVTAGQHSLAGAVDHLGQGPDLGLPLPHCLHDRRCAVHGR